MSGRDYVLVTPAYNEAPHIGATIESVVAQETPPARWAIVSDGSTDATEEVVAGYAAAYPFIVLVRRDPDGAKGFASKVAAFERGYAIAGDVDHAFVGNLDGDVELPAAYFARVLDAFAHDPCLGLAGGWVHAQHGDRLVPQRVSANSVAGAAAVYRRACYEQVGGFAPMPLGGEDSAAEITARYHGWRVRTLPELVVRHRDPVTHGGHGVGAAHFRKGQTNRLLGYDPLFQLAVSVFRCLQPPYGIGGAAMALGYAWTLLKRRPAVLAPPVVASLRAEQRRRLVAVATRRVGVLDQPPDRRVAA